MPPFGRLAALVVSAGSRGEAEAHGRALRRAAPETEEIRVLGPAEAPLAVVAGRHRFRLLVQGRRGSDMQGFLRKLLADAPPARGSVHVQVDIDPQSFL
jgi:primosomal protein N' (replication factor Y)